MGGLYVDWVMFGRCAVMPAAIKSSKGAVLDMFWMLLCRRATCCCESEGGSHNTKPLGRQAPRKTRPGSTRRPDKVQTAAGIGLSRVIEAAEAAPSSAKTPTPSSRRL